MTAPRARPIYFVSTRPEAYEIWGEIDRYTALRLARLIVERAEARFPAIDFQCDADWHVHTEETAVAAAFIEDHLPAWVAEITSLAQAA